MNINIRDYIINNFKNSSKEDIKKSIEESINSKSEEALPGLGVLFEIVWENSSSELQEKIVDIASTMLK